MEGTRLGMKATWWLWAQLTAQGNKGRHELRLVTVKFEVLVRHTGKEMYRAVDKVDLGQRVCLSE